jgi:hypothetical protein
MVQTYFIYGSTKDYPNTFYNINQQDAEILEDLDNIGKMTSKTEQAVIAYLKVDNDDEIITSAFVIYATRIFNLNFLPTLCIPPMPSMQTKGEGANSLFVSECYLSVLQSGICIKSALHFYK